jgi:uncharacterized protein
MNEFSFLGFNFSPVRQEDAGLLTAILKQYPHPLTGYTFATLEAWKPFHHYGWCFVAPDALLISCTLDSDSHQHQHLLQPIGQLSAAEKETILRQAADLDYPLRIAGVCDRFLKEQADFSQAFAVHDDRDLSNYVYSADALARLPGRKYSKKRNLLAQAQGLYSWKVQPLTAALTPSCFSILESIVEEEKPSIEGMLKRELAALEITLRKFGQLQQQGLLISVNERPVAFSIFEAISPTTAAIHFERALRSYKGLYQVINCETAKIIHAQGFEFINREEDLGDPGLRDAKMSYNPVELIPSHEMTFRNPLMNS